MIWASIQRNGEVSRQMEILFIVCPYVARHRLGSFPHCWTTLDCRCHFPSISVPVCLPLLLSICFCPVWPPPSFCQPVLSSAFRFLVTHFCHSLPVSVHLPCSLSVLVVSVLPASFCIHLSRFPSVCFCHSLSTSVILRLVPSCPPTSLVLCFPSVGPSL